MWKKVAIAGGITAAIVGAGTAAMADSGSSLGLPLTAASTSSSAPSGSASSTAAPSAKTDKSATTARLGRRGLHGQIVTRGKDNTFVTHDLIRGKVVSVSGTAIVVTAADKTTQTYVVNATTKVRLRTAGKGASSTISAVKPGDAVLVTGTGTTTLTATHVLDVKK